ncbi:MAG: right-handed parallel beta-helix repeat-containing protein, partial [Ignavibacteriaceae bacterium]|nr:right-handed parallel beta-helix repeat-containing protein [Ignavibacteriaceae bacterium]
MKNLLQIFSMFLLVYLVPPSNIFSQVPYRFENGTTTFTPLTGATNFTWTNTSTDASVSDSVLIPFPFNYMGNPEQYVRVTTDGSILVGSTLRNINVDNSFVGSFWGVIAVYWDDLKVENLNDIKYTVTGTAPSRVMTIEWRRMFLPKTATTTNGEFQVQLHENGEIHFIYGAMNPLGSTSASIGIKDVIKNAAGAATGTFLGINIGGIAANRKYHQSMTQDFELLNIPLPNGTLFKFIPDNGAPYSGTYSLPGAEFQSLSDLATKLNNRGVSGPVTINIAPGVYDDILHLMKIPGVSASNPLTIKNASGQVTLSPKNASSSNNQAITQIKAAIRFDGTQYTTLEGLRIVQNTENITPNTKFNCGMLLRHSYLIKESGEKIIHGARFNTFKDFFIDLDAGVEPVIESSVGVFLGGANTTGESDSSLASSYNTFQDFTIEDFGYAGILFSGSTIPENPSIGNKIVGVNRRSEIRNTTAGGHTVEHAGMRIFDSYNTVIENIDIYGLTVSGNNTRQITGINLGSSNKPANYPITINTVRNVNIWNLSKVTAGTIVATLQGISLTNQHSRSLLVVENSRIYNIQNNHSGASRAIGINSTNTNAPGSSVLIRNNYIYGIKAPNSTHSVNTTIPGATGIAISNNSVATANEFYIQNNTVVIKDSVTNSHSSSVLFLNLSGLANVRLNNNIFVNAFGFSSQWSSVISAPLKSQILKISPLSNSNLYFAPDAVNNARVGYFGPESYKSICDYKNMMDSVYPGSSVESSTFLELPVFQNYSNDLTIVTTASTQINNAGRPADSPIGVLTHDYFGNPRSSTFPDIGAQEFTAPQLDVSGPIILHTAPYLPQINALQAITAHITDPAGVAQGIFLPRVYFKKGINGDFYHTSASSVTDDEYYMQIEYLQFPGFVSPGDTIYYYIAAQDLRGTPNGSTVPQLNCGQSGINPPGSIVPDTLFSYVLLGGSLYGDYLVGTNINQANYKNFLYEGTDTIISGSFTSLTQAINELNLRGLNGPVRFLLTDTLYIEQGDNFGSSTIDIIHPEKTTATNNLTIKPAAGVDARVEFSANSGGLIIRNPHVIVDGSNSLGGTSRNLKIANVATSNGTIAIAVVIADSVTIKNAIVYCGSIKTHSAIFLNSSKYATIENNWVYRASTGIGSNSNSNFAKIIKNYVGSEIENDQINVYGMLIFGSSDILIAGNTVAGVKRDTLFNAYGIAVWNASQNPINTRITGNKIYNIRMTGSGSNQFGVSGIDVQISAFNSNVLIDNNSISGLYAGGYNGPVNNVQGIFVGGTGSGFKIINNSINLTGVMSLSATTFSSSKGIFIYTSGSQFEHEITIMNNVISNSVQWPNSPTFGENYAIFTAYPFSSLTKINNNFYNITGTNAYIALLVFEKLNLQGMVARGYDDFSLQGNPAFTDSLNLKPNVNNPETWLFSGMGQPHEEITEDIEGNPRSNSLETGPVDIGAYEFTNATEPLPISPPNPPTPGGTSEFVLGGALISTVDWGNDGQVPDSVDLIYYPDEPEPVEATSFGFSRWILRTYGGSGFKYNITLYYNPATLGNLSDSLMSVAFNPGNGFSVKSTLTNTTSKTVKVSGLNAGGKFALVETSILAPSNLMALANQWRKIDLQWSDNSTDETGFVIERKLGDSLSVNPYSLLVELPANSTSFMDTTNIGDSVSYTYRIKSINPVIESDWSNQAEVVSLIPVELNSFTASVDERDVVLNWETGSERNNSGFEIQRKTGDDWVKIGFVEGKGSTAENTVYSFIDDWKYESFTGTVYYRLKQIDFDGTFEYSQILSADVDFM